MVIRDRKEQSLAVTSECLDHLGVVAATVRQLGLVESIDARIPLDKRKGAVLSHGQRIMAMIINGLGYVRAPLYMSSRFFKDKAVSQLLGADFDCEALNDDALGRTLDALATYGTTNLFCEVALNVAQQRGLLGRSSNLDTTSITLYGDYALQDNHSSPKPALGYSKDHRPDLKQMVMSLTVNGPAAVPIWFEALAGNSNDKSNFHNTIETFESFKKSMSVAELDDFIWVADSALYNSSKLKNATYMWLTRVPSTVAKAQALIKSPSKDISWEALENGYKAARYTDLVDGQVWMVFFSPKLYETKARKLTKDVAKAKVSAQKKLNTLGRQNFACEKDALMAGEKVRQSLTYHDAKLTIKQVERYKGKGRPPKDAKPEVTYQLCGKLFEDEVKLAPYKEKLGRFVLATNDLKKTGSDAQKALSTYKEQSKVERGFAFCKSDEFQLDHIFLKNPARIEALMMVMALSLMVYNCAQYHLREALKSQGETLPNQLGKAVTRPTLRWIFQLLQGIHVVSSPEMGLLITGMDELKLKVIRLLGPQACEIYGISPE